MIRVETSSSADFPESAHGLVPESELLLFCPRVLAAVRHTAVSHQPRPGSDCKNFNNRDFSGSPRDRSPNVPWEIETDVAIKNPL